MYVPKHFRETDQEKLLEFMRANSFVTLVSILDSTLFASHIPLVIETDGDRVKLTGHLAKGNEQWQAFGTGETLAIFTGPHAYVSPSLYEKRESVPTWNYIAVHAYGVPQIIEIAQREKLERMMDEIIDYYDASYKEQWHSLSDLYRTSMMKGIVAFEMTVTRLEGKYKLSQNRSAVDQHNVAEVLSKSSDPTIAETGEAMKKHLEKENV
jgi:transcriptional regulator